jgi:hypothetical protein
MPGKAGQGRGAQARALSLDTAGLHLLLHDRLAVLAELPIGLPPLMIRLGVPFILSDQLVVASVCKLRELESNQRPPGSEPGVTTNSNCPASWFEFRG